MKRFDLDQTGSHIVAVAVGVLVVGVIAFAGYTVVNRQDTTKDSTTTAATGNTSSEIKSAADLTATSKELDSASTTVDSDLNDSALDADLNDML